MRKDSNIINNIDWLTVSLFFLLAILGWLNIFAAVYDEDVSRSIFDLSTNSGKQIIFIILSTVIVTTIMVIDFRFYDKFGYYIFGAIILLLIVVLLFGKEVAGSKSWFEIGSFRLQPSELGKFAASLAVAKVISTSGFKIDDLKDQLLLFVVIAAPAVLIILQGDAGTALVYSVFLLVFFREGMSPMLIILGLVGAVIFILTLVIPYHWILYTGIWLIGAAVVFFGKRSVKRIIMVVVGCVIISGLVFSVDLIINDVLKPHQQNRIKAFIDPDADPRGAGYNVTQSKIAIGSGGFVGKGFLKGTQTKFDFVPAQSTDFIFCTIGEEHGWIGSLLVISLFVVLLFRIITIAERQKWRFARVYGYSVACILFFHFTVNIGMTIGLFPVIGIPLPLFSYGGSSFFGFTILIFVLLKLDAHRMQVLIR